MDCVNSTGPIRTETRQLPDFNRLFIDSDIDVEWHFTESKPWVEITCGRNLHRKVRTELIGIDSLKISNENTCNWVRGFDNPMKAVLYSACPNWISIKGYGLIETRDSLRTSPLVVQHYGASLVRLKIKTDEIFLDFISPNDLWLCGYARMGHYFIQGYGKNRGENLNLDSCEIAMRGENDAYIQVAKKIWGKQESSRDIYLKGNPINLIEIKKTGKIIRLN